METAVQQSIVEEKKRPLERKIKVVFFTDILTKDYDGAIKTMYQLIGRIPNNRFEYTFVCGIPPKEKSKYRIIKVPTITIPFNISYSAALPRLQSKRITKLLDEIEPDVIHISTPSPLGVFGLRYANNRQIPVLSIYHTHFISYVAYYLKRVPFLIKPIENVIAKIYRKFYNKCSLVYVPTHWMMEELEKYGINPALLKQWHRGIDTKWFNPKRRNEKYIKKIAGNNKPCVLYASRIVWEKNLETLFGIYDEIIKQQLDVNFIMAGTGNAEEEARERMPKALFLGYLNHDALGKLYASSDVFVFPSISETYGNVVVEAAVSGCVPVIANGGGSQALVLNGETGFLCEPNNPKDYVEKIKLILDNPQLKKKMQDKANAFVSMLSWENLANTYFKDIEKLALNNSEKQSPEKT